MALARIKTWNPGDVLTAADLNAEFNNPLNNPISLISPTTGAINFQSSVLHINLAISALSASSGSTGSMPYGASTGGVVWGPSPALSMVRGLTGSVTTGQTMTLAFEQCVLRTTLSTSPGTAPGTYTMTATDTFTLNVGTSGPAANGRDQAAAFASTFVHAYAISTGLGSTVAAGILSSSPTQPALPTSYNAYAYLGSYPYSSASTQFTYTQRPKGAWVYNEIAQALVSSGTSTGETSAGLGATVPLAALAWLGGVEGRNANTASGNAVRVRIISGSNAGTVTVAIASTVVTPQVNSAVFQLPNVSQQFFYAWDSTGGAADVVVHGYKVPNGGE